MLAAVDTCIECKCEVIPDGVRIAMLNGQVLIERARKERC